MAWFTKQICYVTDRKNISNLQLETQFRLADLTGACKSGLPFVNWTIGRAPVALADAKRCGAILARFAVCVWYSRWWWHIYLERRCVCRCCRSWGRPGLLSLDGEWRLQKHGRGSSLLPFEWDQASGPVIVVTYAFPCWSAPRPSLSPLCFGNGRWRHLGLRVIAAPHRPGHPHWPQPDHKHHCEEHEFRDRHTAHNYAPSGVVHARYA